MADSYFNFEIHVGYRNRSQMTLFSLSKPISDYTYARPSSLEPRCGPERVEYNYDNTYMYIHM